ncbi:MAG TPA: ABC-2 family transporter protein [Gemmataceae bacterium]|nr:ABC-2 family transporter protein [Gemmataceae bacterium]
MHGAARYFRLLYALARYALLRELAFRGNYLARVTVEVLWLGILLAFWQVVFTRTRVIANWTEAEYLFFVGCHYALGGLIETFFLENCNSFSELVRSGDLDFYLLKPIDEQFLITCHGIDWATAPNVLLGAAVMVLGLVRQGWAFNPAEAGLFVLLFACGLGLAYSFLVLLSATSVWLVRNQSLYEMWWLFSSLMRYPSDIFQGRLAAPLGWFFTFIIPVTVIVNVPARVMVKRLLDPSSAEFDPWLIGFTVAATAVLLVASRKFFRLSLRRYRSASS